MKGNKLIVGDASLARKHGATFFESQLSVRDVEVCLL